jgi:hypothetical protein
VRVWWLDVLPPIFIIPIILVTYVLSPMLVAIDVRVLVVGIAKGLRKGSFTSILAGAAAFFLIPLVLSVVAGAACGSYYLTASKGGPLPPFVGELLVSFVTLLHILMVFFAVFWFFDSFTGGDTITQVALLQASAFQNIGFLLLLWVQSFGGPVIFFFILLIAAFMLLVLYEPMVGGVASMYMGLLKWLAGVFFLFSREVWALGGLAIIGAGILLTLYAALPRRSRTVVSETKLGPLVVGLITAGIVLLIFSAVLDLYYLSIVGIGRLLGCPVSLI